jgi:hypothetical protein
MSINLHNESDYDFTDISSEVVRKYDFGDDVVTIRDPQYLATSDSGHRILDGDEVSHYIPYGWNKISWRTADDEPHFVK